ncbi:MAG: hypothetical protein AABM66_09835 [Actinomycetota bacterium]
MRGNSLEPLHPNAPEAARRDPELGAKLALLDALRLGDGRIRKMAADELRRRLGARAQNA